MAEPARTLRGETTRQAILDGAFARFGAYGYRRTSMDDLARAAGVSRPAVYTYFANKETVFRVLVTALHEQHLGAARAAATGPGDAPARLLRTLEERFVPLLEILSSSPHGAELIDENSRICGDIGRNAREATLDVLRETIAAGVGAGEFTLPDVDPGVVAAVLFDAAEGAKQDPSTSLRAYRRRLREIVAVVTAGLATSR